MVMRQDHNIIGVSNGIDRSVAKLILGQGLLQTCQHRGKWFLGQFGPDGWHLCRREKQTWVYTSLVAEHVVVVGSQEESILASALG